MAETTVGDALKELREMFPSLRSFRVEHHTYGYQDGRVKESSVVIATKYFYGRTVSDCMAQVRAWKEHPIK